jgi:hypothetical protein
VAGVVWSNASTTYTIVKNSNTWNEWNTAYTTNVTTSWTGNAGIQNYIDNWAFTQGTGGTISYNTTMEKAYWIATNTKYEESKEEKFERLLQGVLQAARECAIGNLEADFHLPNYIGIISLRNPREDEDLWPILHDWISIDPERLRQVEDAFQRGHEEELERRHRREVHEAEALEARRRAELLLISILTHEQKEEWLEYKRVTEVAESGRVWRFFPVWSGSATLMGEDDMRRATLCIHPRERLPEEDGIVALLLMLRAGQENRLLQLAILHNGNWTNEELQIRRGASPQYGEYNEGVGGHVRVEAVA